MGRLCADKSAVGAINRPLHVSPHNFIHPHNRVPRSIGNLRADESEVGAINWPLHLYPDPQQRAGQPSAGMGAINRPLHVSLNGFVQGQKHVRNEGTFLIAALWLKFLALAILCILLLVACGSSGGGVRVTNKQVTEKEYSGYAGQVGSSTDTLAVSSAASSSVPASKAPAAILRVPERFPSIQAAVNAAKPYDMISIAPGIYYESVTVHTPHLTIRGRDRNTVILDGDFRLANGIEVLANDVVIENMTARHFVGNGFLWSGVTGYRASYVTAYANGDYGIFAYGSVEGQFDHDLAAGQPDSGFYIGYCHPCHAVITSVISENNALGYSGTNSGGDLIIENSIWRDNMSGIAPNTLDSEPNPPEADTTIINNLVENNNNFDAPAEALEYPTIGNGIVVTGGNNNRILNNRINGHIYYGILIVSNIDKHFWEPGGNVVENNVVTNSGVADLALAALSAGNNCFSNNQVARTVPPFLQFTHACGSFFAHGGGGDPSVAPILLSHFMQANLGRYKARDWKTVPAPSPQPGMPDPGSNPQGIFTTTEGQQFPMTLAPTSISPGLTLAGLGLSTPFFEIILGFYMYYLPLALYAAWVSVATWDIVRRSEMKGGARIGWLAVVYLIPVLGPIAYYLLGRSMIPRATRIALVIGAPIAYLAISALLLFFIS